MHVEDNIYIYIYIYIYTVTETTVFINNIELGKCVVIDGHIPTSVILQKNV